MANVKITDLTALSGADVADADVFVIVDVNSDQTKKLTRTASKIAISDANDFVTYTRLNANIDIVQDNVAALPDSAANDFITYTRLNANINVVSSNVDTAPTQAEYTTSTINSYPIAVSTSSINKTQVYLDGIYQNKSQYVLANSSSNIQFKVAALVADLSLEIITDF